MLAIVEACKHWKYYIERTIYGMRVVTDHLNFCKFLTTKTFFCRKARWWKPFFSLNLAIEYCEGKSNSANGLFCCPNYIDKDNKLMHIVRYVTPSSAKRIQAQKVSKESS